jgi:diguanylate cyclase (GGDEF)-like protein
MLSELAADKKEATVQAGIIAEKIRATVAEPYALTMHADGGAQTRVEHQCTSSIGVVLFINHELSADQVVRLADSAMYRAKEDGRNMVRFYDSKA